LSQAETPPRVLVVDDDPAIRRLVCLSLELDGLECAEAPSGTEALDLLRNASFDVVVLDLSMPGMDGRETYRLLRERGDNTAVLVLSAYREDRVEGQMRSERFIQKPFDTDALSAAVWEIIQSPRLSDRTVAG
jgi:DNA-binding response OmpR family regulator